MVFVKSENSGPIYFILSLVFIFLALVFFVASCWISASDAQGAIIFIFSIPLILGLLLGAMAISKNHKTVYMTSWIFLGLLALFLIGSFVPPLHFIPGAAIHGVAETFEFFTGKSPMAHMRARNDVIGMIEAELLRTQGKEIDFSKFETNYDWDTICVLGPYTSEETAKSILATPDWDVKKHTPIATDDTINTFVFTDRRRNAVSYVANLKRDLADFSELSQQCFGKVILKVPPSH